MFDTSGRPHGHMAYCLRALVALAFATAAPVHAHGGEDHGETPAVSAAAAGAPTAEAHSEVYEAVVQLDGRNLVVFVDGYATNAPVAGAKVGVTIGDAEIAAQETSPGAYSATMARPLPAGTADIGLIIQGTQGDDLLSLSLPVPATETDEHDDGHFEWRSFALGATAALALLLAIWFGGTRFRRRAALGSLAALACLFSAADPVSAHGGEDHGDAPPPAVAGGNRASRLPDGSVFLPKPSQHVLGVRTLRTGASSGATAIRLQGQVAVDPSGFARVATARGGRLLPVGNRFPRLGEQIAAGQPLFRVEPALSATEAASNAAELSALDREIRIAEQEARRLGSLDGIVARAKIERARVNLAGLRAQRAALARPVNAYEVVRAPIAGAIASVSGTIGELSAPGTVVVEIIGRNGVLVEARGTPATQGRGFASAVGVTRDGRRLPLTLVARSPQLAQGAERLQFRIASGAASLRAGEGVAVESVLTGTTARSGVALPAEAVVRNGSGETIVWVKPSAMIFVPRTVRTQRLPGGQVLVLAGVKPDERVVTQGAALLAQVR